MTERQVICNQFQFSSRLQGVLIVNMHIGYSMGGVTVYIGSPRLSTLRLTDTHANWTVKLVQYQITVLICHLMIVLSK